MVAVAKKSIPVFNSNPRVFNSNYIFHSTNSNYNSNSGIGIGIELQFQFWNWIEPNPGTCPHNIQHIPSCYNNEQITQQTKAISNSSIYISHVSVTQIVPDISPLMPMHQDPLLLPFSHGTWSRACHVTAIGLLGRKNLGWVHEVFDCKVWSNTFV